MKFICAALLCFSLNASAAINLDQPVNLNAKDATATEFMKMVTQQTRVNFILDKNIEFKKNMSVQVKAASLKKVMDAFALEHNVAWAPVGDNLIRVTAKD